MALGADLLLVLGGDGTVNEAVNGLAGSGVPLGIIPAGTANVLSMELGLGSRIGRALEGLAQCSARRVALGHLIPADGSSRYFVCMAGMGLDAKIVRQVNRALKDRTGKLAYWTAGLAQIPKRLEQIEIRVHTADGPKLFRCGFVLASRVRNYGGNLEIASGASLVRDDFEMVVFEGANPLRYAWYMLGVGVRRVQRMQGVQTIAARCIEVLTSAHLQIDGEYAGRQPARLETVPAALNLLTPPNYG